MQFELFLALVVERYAKYCMGRQGDSVGRAGVFPGQIGMYALDRGEVRATEQVVGRRNVHQRLIARPVLGSVQRCSRTMAGEECTATGQRGQVHQPLVRRFNRPRRGARQSPGAVKADSAGRDFPLKRKPGIAESLLDGCAHLLQFPLRAYRRPDY